MSQNNSSGWGSICPMQPYSDFVHASKPEFRIDGCLIECPRTPRDVPIIYFDACDLRTGITLPNLMAECEKGVLTVFYGLDVEVKWTACSPLESMKVPSPGFKVESFCQREFEEALIEGLKKRLLNLFVFAEYESRRVPDFGNAMRELDDDQNPACCL